PHTPGTPAHPASSSPRPSQPGGPPQAYGPEPHAPAAAPGWQPPQPPQQGNPAGGWQQQPQQPPQQHGNPAGGWQPPQAPWAAGVQPDPAWAQRNAQPGHPGPYAPGPGPDAAPAGTDAVGFFRISLRRAFRLKIEPHEVLDDEREALLRAQPPVTSPEVQAFLTWRRSLLFVIAVLLVPLTILDGITTFSSDTATPGLETLRTLAT